MTCIFCDIANGKVETQLIYEDGKVVAFNDLHARAPEHKLIIPKKHIATLNELDDEGLAGHLLLTAKRLANELGVAEDGYRVVMNCNKLGGQEVHHIHLHLLAGRQLQWPPG